jgi:hypothetical protein
VVDLLARTDVKCPCYGAAPDSSGWVRARGVVVWVGRVVDLLARTDMKCPCYGAAPDESG